jgi:hypothetical protein
MFMNSDCAKQCPLARPYLFACSRLGVMHCRSVTLNAVLGTNSCDGVKESRPGKYLAGDKLSHADLAVFCQLSALHCGWLDGERLNE